MRIKRDKGQVIGNRSHGNPYVIVGEELIRTDERILHLGEVIANASVYIDLWHEIDDGLYFTDTIDWVSQAISSKYQFCYHGRRNELTRERIEADDKSLIPPDIRDQDA